MSAIGVGDLVVVVGTYCNCQSVDIGYIADVQSISVEGTECVVCHNEHPRTLTAEIVERVTGRHAWKPLSILRKIEPFAEIEREEEKAEA